MSGEENPESSEGQCHDDPDRFSTFHGPNADGPKYVPVDEGEKLRAQGASGSKSCLLPPAIGLFAIVAIGILFAPLGLLLGYPLAIVIDVAVRRLYCVTR